MEKKMWDPLGDTVSPDIFEQEIEDLQGKVEELRNSSWRIPFYTVILGLIPVILFLIFVSMNLFGEKISGYVLVFSAFPVVMYVSYITSVQRDILLYLICQKNGWAYEPSEDKKRINALIDVFPEVFYPGRGQTIEDQIWGSIDNHGHHDFWSGNFTFTIGEGKGSRTYTHPVFILPLTKKSPINFYLENSSYGAKSGIKTESNIFNKKYRIVSDFDDEQSKNDILQILSPSVIVRLTSLAENYPVFRVYLHSDMIVLEFEKDIWKGGYTNFFKKVAVDPRDEKRYFSVLNDMVGLVSEVIQYI